MTSTAPPRIARFALQARPVGSVREALRLYPLARKLPLTFSPERLAEDLAKVPESWWARHLGPFHDGGWESVSLWAPNGDMRQQRSIGGPFAATPALRTCPYFEDVLNALPGQRHRVRLMRLRAGGRILRHSDPLHTISRELTRVHIPIATSPQVSFRVNGREIPLEPGEVWHIDVRFPHEVRNDSDRDRVHLVTDLIVDPALQSLLDRSSSCGRGSLLGYFVRHSLPATARRWFRVGN